jgi:hypothetical protein
MVFVESLNDSQAPLKPSDPVTRQQGISDLQIGFAFGQTTFHDNPHVYPQLGR